MIFGGTLMLLAFLPLLLAVAGVLSVVVGIETIGEHGKEVTK